MMSNFKKIYELKAFKMEEIGDESDENLFDMDSDDGDVDLGVDSLLHDSEFGDSDDMDLGVDSLLHDSEFDDADDDMDSNLFDMDSNEDMSADDSMGMDSDSEIDSMGSDDDVDSNLFDDQDAPGEEETDPDFQGMIRTVKGANLVYKRKSEDGQFEELWVFNIGKNIKRETTLRRAILAGTDIDPSRQESDDGSQRAESSSMGNVQFLHITGLSN